MSEGDDLAATPQASGEQVAVSGDYLAAGARALGRRFRDLTTGTDFTLYRPKETEVGEFMVAVLVTDSRERPSIPPGWTLASGGWSAPPAGWVWAFVRRSEASDPLSWVSTLDTPTGRREAVVALPSAAAIEAASTPIPWRGAEGKERSDP